MQDQHQERIVAAILSNKHVPLCPQNLPFDWMGNNNMYAFLSPGKSSTAALQKVEAFTCHLIYNKLMYAL